MRNTADVTSAKPIAVLLQSISDVSAINPIVALYDIHGGKVRGVFCPGHHTRLFTSFHHLKYIGKKYNINSVLIKKKNNKN
jgi:hypothetical protein